ncbi:MAG TPA: DUF1501 domain-containing protein, partial [Bdellovibrio sp.]|nr:DUF1501 domain-containing protein [Bdellovibrio sp.]
MNRRDFLTGLSTSVGFATLASCFPRFAFAQEKKGQYFVLIYLPAGWDVSLATAPWIDSTRPAESEYFLEYRQDELIKTSYGFVGPAMKPMEKYLENLRIINGVYINATDVGHPSPSMYAMTGNGQGANSTLSAEIDFNIDKKPFGTIAKGPIVNSGKSLNVMDADSLFTMQKADMSSLITTNSQKMTDVTRAKLSLLQNQDRIDQYFKNLEDIRKTSENSSNIDAIIAAFAADLSSTAFIESKSGNLDTHSAHPGNHMKNLTEAFTEIAEIIGKFEKFSFDGQNSLLSQTTFMIVSDFARTPALNASQGKDHNAQSNSIITIGP